MGVNVGFVLRDGRSLLVFLHRYLSRLSRLPNKLAASYSRKTLVTGLP